MEDIRNEKLQPEAQGLASSCPLCEIEDLFVRDRENPAMPLLTRRGIQLSARLVNDTYALQLSPWQEAGWRDVHVEIDDLMTRPMQGEEKGRGLEDLQLRLARDRLEKTGAVRSITGTLRQAGEADTCKAVVMARVAEGKVLIALSFMGTSKRIFDWVSNFRMRLEDGRHQGFLQLTRQFISHEKEIIFPETARELGMHSLRFRDVMEACKAPGAPYMLWLVGHSQGAAVAQLEMLYLLEEGVLPEYITGYGFASPSVLAGNAAPGDSPMFHILNSDDLVPHMGAVWHAGKLLVYRASPEMRRACYRWRWDAQSVADRKLARNVTGQMTDTAHDIMVGMAYLRLLEEEPLGMIEEGLRSLGHALPYMPGMVAGRVDATMQKAIERVLDIAGEAYEQHVGRPVDLQGVIHIMQTIRSITEQIGMERFARAFGELCIEPHRAQNLEDGMDTAYQYVARMCYRQLLPARDGEWVSDCGQ